MKRFLKIREKRNSVQLLRGGRETFGVAWGDVVVEHMVVCDVSVMFYGRFVYQ
jgi:hypothetical protein